MNKRLNSPVRPSVRVEWQVSKLCIQPAPEVHGDGLQDWMDRQIGVDLQVGDVLLLVGLHFRPRDVV